MQLVCHDTGDSAGTLEEAGCSGFFLKVFVHKNKTTKLLLCRAKVWWPLRIPCHIWYYTFDYYTCCSNNLFICWGLMVQMALAQCPWSCGAAGAGSGWHGAEFESCLAAQAQPSEEASLAPAASKIPVKNWLGFLKHSSEHPEVWL